jgi:hypothetical protein
LELRRVSGELVFRLVMGDAGSLYGGCNVGMSDSRARARLDDQDVVAVCRWGWIVTLMRLMPPKRASAYGLLEQGKGELQAVAQRGALRRSAALLNSGGLAVGRRRRCDLAPAP